VILRAAAAFQDRYARFRYRKRRAPLLRAACADEAVRSYMRSPAYRAVRYRKYRPYILAGVVVYMAGRRVLRSWLKARLLPPPGRPRQ